MGVSRWDGIIEMEAFIDRERSMYGRTEIDEKDLEEEIENGKEQIKAWMQHYRLNKWSNQDNYIEVWIEKKALQGVFEWPCRRMDVGLAPCKGYPSITFLNDASKRFEQAEDQGKNLIILYFGDYDPSGKDIPRSIKENLARMGVNVEMKQVALNKEQIDKYKLPGVPAKASDSRSRSWSGGDVVELDAIEPKELEAMVKQIIKEHFDRDDYAELQEKQAEEKNTYRKKLKDFVNDLGEE